MSRVSKYRLAHALSRIADAARSRNSRTVPDGGSQLAASNQA
ncbi:hypothetical protein [Rhodococcus sp. ABRD24]|nr:hypothetical protein [Rhodococcus sp. ABRD24]